MELHPCPATGLSTGSCPGFVVDHIKALRHGGTDMPDNMQWQTVKEAKAKDLLKPHRPARFGYDHSDAG
jgi:hypothetical protein